MVYINLSFHYIRLLEHSNRVVRTYVMSDIDHEFNSIGTELGGSFPYSEMSSSKYSAGVRSYIGLKTCSEGYCFIFSNHTSFSCWVSSNSSGGAISFSAKASTKIFSENL